MYRPNCSPGLRTPDPLAGSGPSRNQGSNYSSFVARKYPKCNLWSFTVVASLIILPHGLPLCHVLLVSPPFLSCFGVVAEGFFCSSARTHLLSCGFSARLRLVAAEKLRINFRETCMPRIAKRYTPNPPNPKTLNPKHPKTLNPKPQTLKP